MNDSEITYWFDHKPSVAELRRLNRETLYCFPLAMLFALMDAGFDLDEIANATIGRVIAETDELVDLRFRVWLGPECVAEMIELDSCEFRVHMVARSWKPRLDARKRSGKGVAE